MAKENSDFCGKGGLTGNKILQITRGMKAAIKKHSLTNDVASLRHDLRNCSRHCFGDHRKCNGSFCKDSGKGNGGKNGYIVEMY